MRGRRELPSCTYQSGFDRRDLLFRTPEGQPLSPAEIWRGSSTAPRGGARDFGLHMTSARGGEIFEIRDSCLQ